MFLFLVQIFWALLGLYCWGGGVPGLGPMFLLAAFFGLLGMLEDCYANIQAEEYELDRRERLAKLKVGTDAYYEERARQRADDAAEDARRIRNREAWDEMQLEIEEKRRAAIDIREDQRRIGQLF